jgi:hypothetical protein
MMQYITYYKGYLNIDRAKKAIDWFFNVSESQMGIGSNWFATTNTNTGDHASINPESIIFRLKAIRQHRQIWQALAQLSSREYRMITALYDDDYQTKYPPIVKKIFKEKTGLALCLIDDMSINQFLKMAEADRHGTLTDLQRETLSKLKDLTNMTYDNLHVKLLKLLK